mmetsp:Transcript_59083/g.125523  ORF Transcript_59083/g.125523 Transcript_59083/m.125523 type:complete len:423 (-) Transcript_59083:2208-3476(-)
MSEEDDCPLCLEPLEPYDDSHPIQCPSRHCHFNCCIDCLEHLIKATKDDASEASDGNAFRVFLHCPNCRSNLGPSIRDTILLRKVEKYSHKAEDASNLRFKHALEHDEDIAIALEGARHREDEFFERGDDEAQQLDADRENLLDGYLGGAGKGSSLSGSWSFDDEEGVEASLGGPHNSFIFRHHSTRDLDKVREDEADEGNVEPDSTLLCGLDGFMTEQERRFVTAHLVSGDPARLAVATETIHYVSACARQGKRPGSRRRESCRISRKASVTTGMLRSIKEVIQEGDEARQSEEEKRAGQPAAVGATAAQLKAARRDRCGAVEVRKLRRQADMEIHKKMEHMRLYPLPLRMPKYAEYTVGKGAASTVTFIDDMWDGTGECTECCLRSDNFQHKPTTYTPFQFSMPTRRLRYLKGCSGGKSR